MSSIDEPNQKVMESCRLYVDNLTKPLGSLGRMEDMAVRLAGILNDPKPAGVLKAVVIFAGDTAVDGPENKSQGIKSYNEAALVAQGYGPVNAVARRMGAALYVIDVGLQKETDSLPGVTSEKIVHGTHLGMPAMTKEEAEKAVAVGRAVGSSLAQQNVQAVGMGNIGERYMLSAMGITAALMEEELQHAVSLKGFHIRMPEGINFREDPCSLLAAVGSAEIAALFGLVLEACRHHMAVVFDNAVSGAAVMLAAMVYPEVKDFVFPSAVYEEPVHNMQMKKMNLHPFLHYDFSIAQGFGAALGLSLLDASLCMLNIMKTFGSGGVTVAEDGPGKDRQRKDVK